MDRLVSTDEVGEKKAGVRETAKKRKIKKERKKERAKTIRHRL